jgi:hypothetical protein
MTIISKSMNLLQPDLTTTVKAIMAVRSPRQHFAVNQSAIEKIKSPRSIEVSLKVTSEFVILCSF